LPVESYIGKSYSVAGRTSGKRVKADILGYKGSEVELVDTVAELASSSPHLIFTEKPRTFSDLFILASSAAEAVAIEKQRRSALNIFAQGEGKHVQR
jgi:hypothetical protein